MSNSARVTDAHADEFALLLRPSRVATSQPILGPMRSQKVVTLFTALALGGGVATAQPNVRDHRPGVAFPTQAPPAPKEEKFVPRRGQVWVAGQYEWRAC